MAFEFIRGHFLRRYLNFIHFSLTKRRLLIVSFLFVAALAGFFPPVARFPRSSTGGASAAERNVPIYGDAVSLPSMADFSTFVDEAWPLYHAMMATGVYQLTAGLRPGRGEAIPNAADVSALPVKDVAFYNGRGELLSGWLALSSPGAPVIILNHGTPGNRVSMLSRAAFLYNYGFNVLLFDFQSYGKSQGVMSTLGMVESEDILAAISYVHSLPATRLSKIGVLGLSMGATAAVLAASRSTDILALVAESCPVDATLVTTDVPHEAARQADKQLVEEVYGVDITQARPLDAVHKLAGHTAIFFVNGDADTITPLAGMYALFNNAGDPKQYWVVPGAQHAQSFDVDPQEYMQRVDAFFDKYLG
ncbi:MAG TPA: alpha/beta fold hydrolase [Ktedonobacteraceae bacterium]|nr:alpha/beta fold hydrolase [Ktedonobacteraceae bacterium]